MPRRVVTFVALFGLVFSAVAGLIPQTALAAPAVSLASSGTPTRTASFTLSGFPVNANVDVRWDGTTIDSTRTNGSGAASDSFTIPRSPSGPHTVSFVSGSVRVNKTFTIKPSISLSRSRVTPGTRVEIKARGFPANVDVTAGYLECCGIMEPLASGRTSSTGTIGLSIVVPTSWNTNDRPIMTVTLEYPPNSSRVFKQLTVVSASGQSLSLAVTRTNVKVGQKLAYSITSTLPNTNVTLSWDGTTLGTVRTNSSGKASGEVTVPQAVSGPHGFNATAGSLTSQQVIYIISSMRVSPDPAAAGDPVKISAYGFPAGQAISACFWVQGCIPIGSGVTNAKGSLSLYWTVVDLGFRPSVYIYLNYGSASMYWILGLENGFNSAAIEPEPSASAGEETAIASETATSAPDVTATPESTPSLDVPTVDAGPADVEVTPEATTTSPSAQEPITTADEVE